MPDRIRPQLGIVATTIALVVGFAAVVSAELAEWDQERATAIAKELADESRHVYDAFYKMSMRSGAPVGEAYEIHQLKDTLRLLKSEARHLASELGKGAGHDETLSIFKRMLSLVRDARRLIQRIYTQQSLLDAIAKAGDALRRLEPYYDAKALTNPAEASSQAE
jgi:hypothetical protein